MLQSPDTMKIKVGIFFGGASREREVSFAGGRTIYDNLDKSIFEAVPIFVDQTGRFIQLDWPFIYRGTIRDFFPPASFLPASENHFQIYADSLKLSDSQQLEMLREIGKPLKLSDLKRLMDVAFLALHGRCGEDGSIQGLLEWLEIPFTGSGIGPSALGMNKSLQKRLMKSAFDLPDFEVIPATDWSESSVNKWFHACASNVGFPMVVKPANQGSSLGVSVLENADMQAFEKAVNHAFFRYHLSKEEWNKMDQHAWIRKTCDLREGIGLPLRMNEELVMHPDELLEKLEEHFAHASEVWLEALDHESEVVVEAFIAGREFSCVVIVDDHAKPIALPPTEIVKSSRVYTYQGKYLPGQSRKLTPIDCAPETLHHIRRECERLFAFFGFEVYARIDGFLTKDGQVFLNDPNTTSGMMPSSFFFHQAAEIGLDPSHFATYIIRTSLAERLRKQNILHLEWGQLLNRLDEQILAKGKGKLHEKRIAVVMGGYSSERHISVESGRNIYEKIGSSEGYSAVPVFLKGTANHWKLYEIPVSMMLKDNADDIAHRIDASIESSEMSIIRKEFAELSRKYAGGDPVFQASEWTLDQLKLEADAVFIALHGRPGEDGEIQTALEARGIPFNGSRVHSSQLTINKFETNRILRENGFLVANHLLVEKHEWLKDHKGVLDKVQNLGFPLIAKPADDGCSSAVKKIKTIQELEAYATNTFRNSAEFDEQASKVLGLHTQEEFPAREYFLLETFIDKGTAAHFLEITGGMLTRYNAFGKLEYEVFEPSEALAGGEVLSLAEKFLAGEGQNITPARYSKDVTEQMRISKIVREELAKVAMLLQIEGYCRIDAFVRVYPDGKVEVIIIEINSLPGMTPATCIYHQAAINGYKPAEFITGILDFGEKRQKLANS